MRPGQLATLLEVLPLLDVAARLPAGFPAALLAASLARLPHAPPQHPHHRSHRHHLNAPQRRGAASAAGTDPAAVASGPSGAPPAQPPAGSPGGAAFTPAQLVGLPRALAALRLRPGGTWAAAFWRSSAGVLPGLRAGRLAALASGVAALRTQPPAWWASAFYAAVAERLPSFSVRPACASHSAEHGRLLKVTVAALRGVACIEDGGPRAGEEAVAALSLTPQHCRDPSLHTKPALPRSAGLPRSRVSWCSWRARCCAHRCPSHAASGWRPSAAEPSCCPRASRGRSCACAPRWSPPPHGGSASRSCPAGSLPRRCAMR
jgi:hypothetical protein